MHALGGERYERDPMVKGSLALDQNDWAEIDRIARRHKGDSKRSMIQATTKPAPAARSERSSGVGAPSVPDAEHFGPEPRTHSSIRNEPAVAQLIASLSTRARAVAESRPAAWQLRVFLQVWADVLTDSDLDTVYCDEVGQIRDLADAAAWLGRTFARVHRAYSDLSELVNSTGASKAMALSDIVDAARQAAGVCAAFAELRAELRSIRVAPDFETLRDVILTAIERIIADVTLIPRESLARIELILLRANASPSTHEQLSIPVELPDYLTPFVIGSLEKIDRDRINSLNM